MPEEDGLSLVRFLKQSGNVPVIMLTATASPIDRVVGLELGADDYLAKPCEMRELLARVRSVLRRSTVTATAAPGTPNRTVKMGTKWLDLDARTLRDEEENEHPLTASEFGLLKAFAENPKRVLTRERLLDLAQARDSEAFDRAIDVKITRIRRKIEPDPAHPRVIKTVRGAGYVFSPDGGGEGRSPAVWGKPASDLPGGKTAVFGTAVHPELFRPGRWRRNIWSAGETPFRFPRKRCEKDALYTYRQQGEPRRGSGGFQDDRVPGIRRRRHSDRPRHDRCRAHARSLWRRPCRRRPGRRGSGADRRSVCGDFRDEVGRSHRRGAEPEGRP